MHPRAIACNFGTKSGIQAIASSPIGSGNRSSCVSPLRDATKVPTEYIWEKIDPLHQAGNHSEAGSNLRITAHKENQRRDC